MRHERSVRTICTALGASRLCGMHFAPERLNSSTGNKWVGEITLVCYMFMHKEGQRKRQQESSHRQSLL